MPVTVLTNDKACDYDAVVKPIYSDSLYWNYSSCLTLSQTYPR